jgi:hypothetical protein
MKQYVKITKDFNIFKHWLTTSIRIVISLSHLGPKVFFNFKTIDLVERKKGLEH